MTESATESNKAAAQAAGHTAAAQAARLVDVAGVSLEMIQRGSGRPVLFLHPHIGMERSSAFIDELALGATVYAPSHPGFGHSERPQGMTSIDAVSYLYLELLDRLDLRDVLLVGSSLGGWIAASMAVKSTQRVSRLVLIDPIGAKFGARDQTDIADIYSIPEKKFVELAYHDGEFARRDIDALSDEELVVIARNSETTARYGWSPYMYDPQLRHLFYRINVPTLVLWGENDRFAPLDYGSRYAQAIRGSMFRLIEAAGHFPHIEQPRATAAEILQFGRGA
jgi:pimeloyl-ACP methyl ester carboxylesterase